MNKNIFEEKWTQIRAQSQAWWSLFTEEDLKKVEKAPIKLDKYAMMLRMKYGYTHERAREEINKRIADLVRNPPTTELVGGLLSQPNDAKVSTVRKPRAKKSKSFSDRNIEIE